MIVKLMSMADIDLLMVLIPNTFRRKFEGRKLQRNGPKNKLTQSVINTDLDVGIALNGNQGTKLMA